MPGQATAAGRSAYDPLAAEFDRRRPLPDDVATAIRAKILAALKPRPEVLDLGCGAGRIGLPFVRADDGYIGMDSSMGMLRAFASRDPPRRPSLVRADGTQLPFANSAFDGVLLVQVLSGVPGWRHLLREVRRVLRPDGVLFVGQSMAPPDGLDARMKQRLAELLADMGHHPYQHQPRQDAFDWLTDHAAMTTTIAARWPVARTPSEFMERHGNGVRIMALDPNIRSLALSRLADWAKAGFGGLDAIFPEEQNFELRLYRFQQGIAT